jgi:hypothetical protein
MTAEPFVASGVNVRINPEALVDDIAAALDAFRVDLMNNGAKVWMSCPLRMLPVAGWVVPLTVLLPIQQKKERGENKGMTIDERIEMAALIAAQLHADVQSRLAKMDIYVARLDKWIATHEKRAAQIESNHSLLIRLVDDLESRMNRLEGGRQ